MKRWYQRRLGAYLIVALTMAAIAGDTPPAQSHRAGSVTPMVVANNRAVAALAAHLKRVRARMYGVYWCPHCTRQKELFGSAFRDIDYVECDPRGENPRPALCQKANVRGYPTWEINGKFLVGVQSLEELAEASNFKGSRDF